MYGCSDNWQYHALWNSVQEHDHESVIIQVDDLHFHKPIQVYSPNKSCFICILHSGFGVSGKWVSLVCITKSVVGKWALSRLCLQCSQTWSELVMLTQHAPQFFYITGKLCVNFWRIQYIYWGHETALSTFFVFLRNWHMIPHVSWKAKLLVRISFQTYLWAL